MRTLDNNQITSRYPNSNGYKWKDKKRYCRSPDNLAAELERAGLAFGRIEQFATPRRMALLVHDLAERQPDQRAGDRR